MKEDNIFIHLHQGPDHHIRSTANKLLYMAKEYSEKDILTDMANMSHTHRIGILRWLNENISNEQANERVFLIERLLRELQDKRAEGLKQNCKEFVNFIKLVHSNELITYLDIRGVLHDPEVLKLYDSEIRICDKQASPLGRTLCNVTSVALQVEPNMQMPDPVNCPRRNNNLILETKDLTDGHVVSCNPANIINPEVRCLLQYAQNSDRTSPLNLY